MEQMPEQQILMSKEKFKELTRDFKKLYGKHSQAIAQEKLPQDSEYIDGVKRLFAAVQAIEKYVSQHNSIPTTWGKLDGVDVDTSSEFFLPEMSDDYSLIAYDQIFAASPVKLLYEISDHDFGGSDDNSVRKSDIASLIEERQLHLKRELPQYTPPRSPDQKSRTSSDDQNPYKNWKPGK